MSSVWLSGNGYQILDPRLNGGATVVDPAMMNMDGVEIFAAFKATLGGGTMIKGGVSKGPIIQVTVPGGMALVPDFTTTATQTTTIISPLGTSLTLATWLTAADGPNYQPNSTDGNQKVVKFAVAVMVTPTSTLAQLQGFFPNLAGGF